MAEVPPMIWRRHQPNPQTGAGIVPACVCSGSKTRRRFGERGGAVDDRVSTRFYGQAGVELFPEARVCVCVRVRVFRRVRTRRRFRRAESGAVDDRVPTRSLMAAGVRGTVPEACVRACVCACSGVRNPIAALYMESEGRRRQFNQILMAAGCGTGSEACACVRVSSATGSPLGDMERTCRR
jgi:hypothetical protein